MLNDPEGGSAGDQRSNRVFDSASFSASLGAWYIGGNGDDKIQVFAETIKLGVYLGEARAAFENEPGVGGGKMFEED